jgi:hypothetical protein
VDNVLRVRLPDIHHNINLSLSVPFSPQRRRRSAHYFISAAEKYRDLDLPPGALALPLPPLTPMLFRVIAEVPLLVEATAAAAADEEEDCITPPWPPGRLMRE